MTEDVQELIRAYLDRDFPAARREELLARVEADPEFRRRCAEELHLLGLLQVARSGEPRWLRLHEELAGEPAADPLPPTIESRVLARVERHRRWGRRAVALAIGVAGIAVGAVVALSSVNRVPPAAPAPQVAGTKAPDAEPIGVLVGLSDVVWVDAPQPPVAGSILTPRALRISHGRLTISFVSGVLLTVEGPAELELKSLSDVVCLRGKLRARIPRGAEGFTIRTPDAVVIDRGTELGVNVEADQATAVRVFQGGADISLLDRFGNTTSLESLPPGFSVTLDAKAATIRPLDTGPERFTSFVTPEVPELRLDRAYRAAVREARPWGYWACDRIADGRVVNQIPGHPGLLVRGGVRVETNAHGIGALVFRAGDPDQLLVLEELWTPPRRTGFAMEAWFLADHYEHAVLGGLEAPPETPGHTFLFQLLNRTPRPIHNPCVVRALDRWPPGQTLGTNLHSVQVYQPNRWHHVVAQRDENRFELYLDGRLTAVVPDNPSDSQPMRVIFGRLWATATEKNSYDLRPFVGRLAEIAIYERMLPAAEIAKHAGL